MTDDTGVTGNQPLSLTTDEKLETMLDVLATQSRALRLMSKELDGLRIVTVFAIAFGFILYAKLLGAVK